MKDTTRKIPWWVWLVSLALASTQPLLGLWLAYAPPEGYVATGLHIPDSSLFLQSMRMFFNGFESQYVTCQSPVTSGVQFYPLPHLWLYGALGALARLIGSTDFAAYFAANGAGAFLYLMVIYIFLREAAPRQANLGFLLFALSGGPGGVLFLATRVLGMHSALAFEDYFRRFALYELFEGAHLQPILCFPRLYYTLSLALCLAALVLIIKGRRLGNRRLLLCAGALFLPGMFIDMRYGAFTLALAFLYLWQDDAAPRPIGRAHAFACLLVPGIAGGAVAWLLMSTNRAAVFNHVEVANTAMWLTPFLSVAALHLLVAPRETLHRTALLPTIERTLTFGAMGYLLAFAVFFAVYQVYWGNILVARDAAAALAVSDWAFIGAVAGGLFGLFRMRRTPAPALRRDWIVLWLLSFLVMAITAFGGGWWLNFGPQRLQIFLWLPLCIVSAGGLQSMGERHSGRARALTAALVVCGTASAVVAVLFFQGPLGFRPGPAGRHSPYAGYHAEVMTANDAAAIEGIRAGRVLAPNLAADVVALNRANPVVWGTGSFNMSDQPYAAMGAEVQRFFAPGTDAQWRLEFLERWHVAWVYCPETWPVPTAALEELRAVPFLEEATRHGAAALFRAVVE